MKIALKTTADLSKPTVDAFRNEFTCERGLQGCFICPKDWWKGVPRENVIYNAYIVNENNIKTDKLNPKKACGNETPQ